MFNSAQSFIHLLLNFSNRRSLAHFQCLQPLAESLYTAMAERSTDMLLPPSNLHVKMPYVSLSN